MKAQGNFDRILFKCLVQMEHTEIDISDKVKQNT